jgi:hypothetical protein
MSSRPFGDFLREHKRGETHDMISDKLQELVAAVSEAKKKGVLQINITMKPAGDEGAFELTVDPVLKLPKTNVPSSLFFVTPENNLTKQAPQQILDLAGSGPTIVYKGVS